MDTNILSTFAKVGRMALLLKLLDGFNVAISANVFSEVRKAEEKGHDFCKDIIDLVHEGVISVLSPNTSEYQIANDLPKSFGLGEKDSVAMAMQRKAIVVTNEKKVVNFCKRNDIEVLNLNHILRALWVMKILSKKDVRKLMKDMEEMDNLVITSKEEIIKD